ncbi:MAG: hypothetical protein KA239_10270, partial [Bacteroidia bacterium]|nr:hypothetical protein [Bacteroidia bacterium]
MRAKLKLMSWVVRLLGVWICLFAPVGAYSQMDSVAQPAKGLRIHKAVSPIQVDGKIEESDWKSAEVARNFWQQYPYDTADAVSHTEVRVTYNDQFLYISAVCWDDKAGDY